MDLRRDQIVGQKYQLVELLGEGGMGAVWSAFHVVTRKPVAIKFLKASDKVHVTEQLAQRFVREARAASAIHHPNVVEIHDILTLEDGSPMMVMDLLRGQTLASLLELRKSLTAEETATIMAPVVSAVNAAHAQGIVHRDLKPENLFLAQLGDGRVEPKVLDFGIAKLSASEGDAKSTSNLTATGSMLGTPYYMSPEQMFGEKDIDARSDIWSLGVIMYECMTGRRPFDGENFGQLLKAISTRTLVPLEQIAPHTPRDVAGLVDRMIRVERGQRPSSLQEVHTLLLTKVPNGRDSSRISVPNIPAGLPTAHRTAFITPQPGTPPGYSAPIPQRPVITGPMQPPAGGPTIPNAFGRADTPPNSGYPATPSRPTTLGGASTSQAGLPPVVPMQRGSGGIVGAIVAGVALLCVIGAGVLWLQHHNQPAAGLHPTADAQPSTAAATSEPPSATPPPPASTPAPPPATVASATAAPPDSGLADTTPKPPPPSPAPANNTPSTHTHHTSTPTSPSNTSQTTVPGGVATTVPF